MVSARSGAYLPLVWLRCGRHAQWPKRPARAVFLGIFTPRVCWRHANNNMMWSIRSRAVDTFYIRTMRSIDCVCVCHCLQRPKPIFQSNLFVSFANLWIFNAPESNISRTTWFSLPTSIHLRNVLHNYDNFTFTLAIYSWKEAYGIRLQHTHILYK